MFFFFFFFFFFPHICFLIATCGLLETNYVFRVTARVTQLLTFPRRFREKKIMRNTGQGGRLKTICPELFFFDFQTGDFMLFKVIAHRKIWRYFSAKIHLHHIAIFCVSGRSNETSIFFFFFFFRSVIPWKPELNIIKTIQRFSSSCFATREAIKFSESSS